MEDLSEWHHHHVDGTTLIFYGVVHSSLFRTTPGAERSDRSFIFCPVSSWLYVVKTNERTQERQEKVGRQVVGVEEKMLHFPTLLRTFRSLKCEAKNRLHLIFIHFPWHLSIIEQLLCIRHCVWCFISIIFNTYVCKIKCVIFIDIFHVLGDGSQEG